MRQLLPYLSIIAVFLLPHMGTGQFNSFLVPKATSEITIDGKLTEPDWQKEASISDFVPYSKFDAEMQKTKIWMVQEQDALVVAAECMEEFMHLLTCNAVHDGDVWMEDHLEIFLDAKGERNSYVQICINAAGTISDAYFPIPGIGGGLPEWESKAEAKTFWMQDRWCLEVRIPFASLPAYSPGNDWTFHIARSRKPITPMDMTCLKTPIKSFHDISAFDFLRGIGGQSSAIFPVSQTFGEFVEGVTTAHVTLQNTADMPQVVTVFVDSISANGSMVTASEQKLVAAGKSELIAVPWRCERNQSGRPVTMRIDSAGRQIHSFSIIVERVQAVLGDLQQNVLYFSAKTPATAVFMVRNAKQQKNQKLKWELLSAAGTEPILSGWTTVSGENSCIRIFDGQLKAGRFCLRRTLYLGDGCTMVVQRQEPIYLAESPWEQ